MSGGGLWRSRWAALGAAVAVSLGGGGVFLAQAAPGPNESTVVSVTPARVLDTRDPQNVGLAGPFVSRVSQKLVVTGPIPTATAAGTVTATVVPVGATGVLLNVTAVGATADGFLSVRPGDASGVPSTSSLNFSARSVVPNAVQVAVPTSGPNAGQIDITYDAYGASGPTTDVLIDVVGYTTNQGIQSLVADLAAKANTSALPIAASGRTNNVVPNLTFVTPIVLLSATINAPVAGVIQITGSVSLTGLPSASRMTCRLSIGAGSTSGAGDLASTSRTEDIGSASAPGHCTTIGSVNVAAGTHVLNLVADGATGIDPGSATINAVFYPT